MSAARKVKPVTPKPEATPAAIDNALLGQLTRISQVLSIIKLTSESMIEPENWQVTCDRAHDALDAAHSLLDTVLERLEAIRGKVAS